MLDSVATDLSKSPEMSSFQAKHDKHDSFCHQNSLSVATHDKIMLRAAIHWLWSTKNETKTLVNNPCFGAQRLYRDWCWARGTSVSGVPPRLLLSRTKMTVFVCWEVLPETASYHSSDYGRKTSTMLMFSMIQSSYSAWSYTLHIFWVWTGWIQKQHLGSSDTNISWAGSNTWIAH